MKNSLKRFAAILLTLVMLVGCASALAETTAFEQNLRQRIAQTDLTKQQLVLTGEKDLFGSEFTVSAQSVNGVADCLIQARIGPLPGMLMCGGSALGIAFLLRSGTARGQGEFRLQVILADRSVWLPALRDSGNLLRDGPGGLPVIVAPAALLGPLLPSGLRCADLSTLPPGWRFVRARTAAGSRMMMCFHPDGMSVRGKNRVWPADGWVAPAELEEERALLPEAFFMEQKEGRYHAGL